MLSLLSNTSLVGSRKTAHLCQASLCASNQYNICSLLSKTDANSLAYSATALTQSCYRETEEVKRSHQYLQTTLFTDHD